MKLVLLGDLPRLPFLRRYYVRRRSFLGTRLLEEGVQPAAMIATPLPVGEILRNQWERYGPRLLAIYLRRYRARMRGTEGDEAGARHAARDFYRSVPVCRVASVKDPRCAEILKDLSPDVVVHLGGREIIPERVLRVPHLGVLGAHWGALPEYRGMNVTEWAVFHGDRPHVSVQFLSAGVDSGDVILQRPLPVRKADTLEDLRERSSELGAELLLEALLRLRREGRLDRNPQSPDAGRQFFTMHPRIRRLAEQRVVEVAEP